MVRRESYLFGDEGAVDVVGALVLEEDPLVDELPLLEPQHRVHHLLNHLNVLVRLLKFDHISHPSVPYLPLLDIQKLAMKVEELLLGRSLWAWSSS